jgi:GxxExxY protein
MKTQNSVYSETQYPLSKLTEKIIGCAIRVHKELGPGFVEKIYQGALAKEFTKNKVVYEKEKKITINALNILNILG